jgi:DNA repair photolyase
MAEDDGWGNLDAPLPPLKTTVSAEQARTIISYNDSPDLPVDRTLNPYRGCEHGCVYCYARPSHAYWGLSPGLDFESRLFYKPDAAKLLIKELSHPDYRAAPIAIGVNTDAYQPVERRLALTRSLLEIFARCGHPVTLVTKSALVERDIDLLSEMAKDNLVEVAISVTTLDENLARLMEPRASSPERRLQAIARLNAAGIPTSVIIAPLIPALTDHHLEKVMERARDVGASDSGYILIRLPNELKELFEAWLQTHFPDRAAHVLARMRDLHEGALYRSRFGQRLRGSGPFAELFRQRFRIAYERLHFSPAPPLVTDRFRPPQGDQLVLF